MFIWDSRNQAHIARHDVEPYEAEEAMTDPSRVKVNTHGIGEEKRGLIGKTEDGRFLVVIYTKREDGFFVITARDAEEEEKKWYRRRNK